MPNQSPQPFGRIRLPQVIEAWSDGSRFNPRLLASELAGVLRTLGPANQVIDAAFASVTLYDPATGAGGITLEALAAYFEQRAAGITETAVETASGSVQAGAVLLARHWIARLEFEAESRAELAAALHLAAPAPAPGQGPQPATQHQPPLTGSAPECLALRQAQQRIEGEHSASHRLEAAEQRCELLARENEQLRAQLSAQEHRTQQAQEAAEQHRRAAEDDRRARTLLEDQLRDHAGILAFMDTSNPLAPVEGQHMVAAWCDLTENGTTDPTASSGIGIGELAKRWWRDNVGQPTDSVTKRLSWALAWPARKNGGAVSKKHTKKG